jgi:hypothetical protein
VPPASFFHAETAPKSLVTGPRGLSSFRLSWAWAHDASHDKDSLSTGGGLVSPQSPDPDPTTTAPRSQLFNSGCAWEGPGARPPKFMRLEPPLVSPVVINTFGWQLCGLLTNPLHSLYNWPTLLYRLAIEYVHKDPRDS